MKNWVAHCDESLKNAEIRSQLSQATSDPFEAAFLSKLVEAILTYAQHLPPLD